MELVACLHCGKEFPPLDFEITKTVGDKVYRRRKCKVCKRKIQQTRIRRICEWVIEFKKNSYCKNCGMNDFRALVFHHRVPEDKTGHVGELAGRGWSLKRVQAEIAMCDVLCANCHAITHYEMKGLPMLEEMIK